MLKLGICNAGEDTPVRRIWRRGLMSASLLHIGRPPNATERDRFERLMSQVRLSNGVARTTTRNRFPDLNEQTQHHLLTLFPRGHRLSAEDWAISSGITAAEWYERLRADYPAVQFRGSDKVLYLIEARLTATGEIYILEPDGTPIQYIRPPFVVSLIAKQNWAYAVNRRVQQQAARQWSRIGQGLAVPRWARLDEARDAVKKGPFELRGLPLIHPEALDLVSESFQIHEHSIFNPLTAPVDVIRTMNILNRAYFDEGVLSRAIAAVAASVRPGGLWIVGRTTDETGAHDVSFLRRTEQGWEAITRLGNGSEIEALALR